MAETPKDRTPLIVQAAWEDWDQFTDHLESVRANDNRTWTRDFYPEHPSDPHKPDPEIDRILEGLLEPRKDYDMAQNKAPSLEERDAEAGFRARNSDGVYASLGDERLEAEAMLAFYQRQIDHGSAALDRGLETYRERYGVDADMERITASHNQTTTQETLLERIEREAREKGQDLSQPQERDHDRSDELER